MATDSISSTQKFRGLSTDTKPTQNVQAMSLFIETETGDVYEYSGTSWTKTSIAGAAKVTQNTLLSGEDQTNDVLKTEQRFSYEIIAASQTAQVMGGAGAVGDFLHRVIISVNTAATGTCSIDDGAGTNIPLTVATTVVGVYSIEINAKTVTGAWRVTTGAGVTALAVGRFT